MKKTIIFTLLLISLSTYAQKKVKAFGYVLEVPKSWEITRDDDSKEIFLEGEKASDDSQPMIYIKTYDVKKFTSKEAIFEQVATDLRENLGRGYEYTVAQMQKEMKFEVVKNNQTEFGQFTMEEEPDGDGDYSWARIWVTDNEGLEKFIFFIASSDKSTERPDVDQSEAVNNVLKTIRWGNGK